METDLKLRLQAYATSVDAPIPANTTLYADALAAATAASIALSAGIICSHTRVLRGDSPPSYIAPGQDELDFLAADKPLGNAEVLPTGQSAGQSGPLPVADGAQTRPRLARHPGQDTLDDLVRGAAGIPFIKGRNG